ncbi:unnamed protein product [Durusdinium trenchii]|uniref:Uncharacterized protein n=1 Tax=Durusdinium trenchii TaxID=1381693 RepID=A0ABP0Q4X1_9DINO
MLTIFGNGLEIFLPKTRLKPGYDMASAKLDPPTCAERPILTASPDEEALPFKSLYALCYNSGLRLYAEPESLHPMWNDLKNALKRAEFQPSLLLGILLSQASHGPFDSGAHQWTKQECVKVLSKELSPSDFAELRECMLKDRYGQLSTDIPDSPEDLEDLSAVQHLPIFAKYKSWFQCIVSLYKLSLDWSLNTLVLERAVEMHRGSARFDVHMAAPLSCPTHFLDTVWNKQHN